MNRKNNTQNFRRSYCYTSAEYLCLVSVVLAILTCLTALPVFADSITTEAVAAEDSDEGPRAGDICKLFGRTYYVTTRKYAGKGKGGGTPCKDCELDCHVRANNPCPSICKLRDMDRQIFGTTQPGKGDKSISGCYMKPPGGYCTIKHRKLRNGHKLQCVYRSEIENSSED